MAKNNNKKTTRKPDSAPKGFATNRKRLNVMARIMAVVLVAAMVITTLFTWGLGLVD